MLVVDESFAIELCLARVGDDALDALKQDQLVAPPLLWSEVPSVLHEMVFRGEMTPERELGDQALTALVENTVKLTERRPMGLTRAAWKLSTGLGWAKTYDAEYLATAQLLECRLVTVDHRLPRGAGRLGFVVSPDELVV